MKILIVEDEPRVAAFIKKGFEENRIDADIAPDGLSAGKLAMQNRYDLYLLDIIIPVMNGLDLCRKLKQANPDIPVIMLTALGTTEDKLSGFDAGADDYLVKPFEFRELMARVRVLLKKTGNAPEAVNRLVNGDLELDLDKKVAFRSGIVIELTVREFALLEYFMRNSGRVLSRNDIAEKVWDLNFNFGTNIVDVYVNFLRKKIDKDFDKKLIRTKVGFGYIFGD